MIESAGDETLARRIGERAWIWNGQWQRAHGTTAAMIVMPAAQAVALPDGTGFAESACLGIPALTAFDAIRLLGDVQGKTVLVIGATSAVGHYAVQMAVLAVATVIGTVGSAERVQHALAAGVATTIH